MQTGELANTFIEALHALERGSIDQVDGIVALFAADAVLSNAALRLAGEERRGTAQIRAFWASYREALGTMYSEFHAVTISEDTAGLFWTTRGIGEGETDERTYDGATMLLFNSDGKIGRFHGYYDTAQLKREIAASKK